MRIGRLATVLILCGAWLAAAYLLWRTSVPASIRVGGLDQHRYFTAIELARASKYERFTDILWVAQVAATIVALLVLTRRSPRLASSIGLGPVGTGVIVGMVMLVTLWFVRLPFGFLSQWWDARHGLAPHDYVSWIFAPWAQVLSEAVFGLVTIVIVMGLAGKLGNRWWIAGAPAFTAIVCAFAFLGGYLAPIGTHRIHQLKLRETVYTLERREHVGGTPVNVQDVGKVTKQANAFSSGFGPSRHVVLWNTLFRPPFTFGEVRFVLAHELGHTWHKHVLKAVGWFALFAFPIAWFVTAATRRRGGLGNPASLPLAMLSWPVVLKTSASKPLATFWKPSVFRNSVPGPIATLRLPVVLLPSALVSRATSALPLVSAGIIASPSATLSSPVTWVPHSQLPGVKVPSQTLCLASW